MSKLKGIPTTRHSLRLPSIAIFVLLGCLIPLRPNLLLTVLVFAFLNGVASLLLVFAAGPRLAGAAFASAVLFTATLLFSEWGFSTPKPMYTSIGSLLLRECC